MAKTSVWKHPTTGKELSNADLITITVSRDDLSAFHRSLDVAANHLDEARGSDGRVTFVDRLVRLKKTVLDATWDHDGVPASQRNYNL